MRAFSHADQHDVHHADAAHHQRDEGNGGNQQRHGGRGFFHGLFHRVAAHGEKVFAAVALAQHLRDGGISGGVGFAVFHAHSDAAQGAGAQHARHDGGVGQPNIERVGIAKRAAFGRRHAYHAHGHAAQQQHFAHGVFAIFKQRVLGVGVYHRVLRLLAHTARVKGHAAGHFIAHGGKVLLAHAIDIGGFFGIAITRGAAGLHAWADGF